MIKKLNPCQNCGKNSGTIVVNHFPHIMIGESIKYSCQCTECKYQTNLYDYVEWAVAEWGGYDTKEASEVPQKLASINISFNVDETGDVSIKKVETLQVKSAQDAVICMGKNVAQEPEPISVFLPCPHCGTTHICIVDTKVYHSENGLFTCVCNECSSRGDFYGTREEAIAAWNKRAAEDKLREEIASLKKQLEEMKKQHTHIYNLPTIEFEKRACVTCAFLEGQDDNCLYCNNEDVPPFDFSMVPDISKFACNQWKKEVKNA